MQVTERMFAPTRALANDRERQRFDPIREPERYGLSTNTGVGRATGEVISLTDGKVTWRTTVPSLLHAPRGVASALTAAGADVIVASGACYHAS